MMCRTWWAHDVHMMCRGYLSPAHQVTVSLKIFQLSCFLRRINFIRHMIGDVVV